MRFDRIETGSHQQSRSRASSLARLNAERLFEPVVVGPTMNCVITRTKGEFRLFLETPSGNRNLVVYAKKEKSEKKSQGSLYSIWSSDNVVEGIRIGTLRFTTSLLLVLHPFSRLDQISWGPNSLWREIQKIRIRRGRNTQRSFTFDSLD